MNPSDHSAVPAIEKYRHLLGPRYATFRLAFDAFERHGGHVVVELGTSRSFVSGGIAGVGVNDPRYWQPGRPEVWDWGAGLFTRVCAEQLRPLRPEIHTVDISRQALEICVVITGDYHDIVQYHLCTSEEFLRWFPGKIDLLYMDAGETGEGADELHLREAEIVIARDLLTPHAVILVDDVHVPGMTESKGRLSIPYLREQGFEILHEDYQVALQRPQH